MKKLIIIFGTALGVTLTIGDYLFETVPIDKAIVIFLALLFPLTLALIKFNSFYFKKMAKGAPYVPTDSITIQHIITLANLKNGEKVVDLGSGDGCLAIELAKENPEIEVHGYEISPILVAVSKYKILKNKLKNVKIFKKSFWNINLENYDTIVLYGIPYIFDELSQKIENEAKKDVKIISNKFEFPMWKKVESSGRAQLYKVSPKH